MSMLALDFDVVGLEERRRPVVVIVVIVVLRERVAKMRECQSNIANVKAKS